MTARRPEVKSRPQPARAAFSPLLHADRHPDRQGARLRILTMLDSAELRGFLRVSGSSGFRDERARLDAATGGRAGHAREARWVVRVHSTNACSKSPAFLRVSGSSGFRDPWQTLHHPRGSDLVPDRRQGLPSPRPRSSGHTTPCRRRLRHLHLRCSWESATARPPVRTIADDRNFLNAGRMGHALRVRVRHPGAFLRHAPQICAIQTHARSGEGARPAVPGIARGRDPARLL
jgi:hypothetical protein